MRIQIFNVEHGFCAYIIANNGNVVLVDCGYNDTTGFRPSSYLPRNGCSGIEHLFVSNFDQDHISDLPALRAILPITLFSRNRSLPPEALRRIKETQGPISRAMDSLLDMHENWIHEVPDPPDFAGIEIETFCNSYPTFTDTNNLSLVTFLRYDGFGILFPGDIELAGWRTLLERESFRTALRCTSVLVASHHGRQSGYCAEAFDYCTPYLVIVSDARKQFATQEQDYANHAQGVPWDGDTMRYVLSTRRDGMITITKEVGAPWSVTTD